MVDVYIGSTLHSVAGTTRTITFFVGNPRQNCYLSLLLGGYLPHALGMYLAQGPLVFPQVTQCGPRKHEPGLTPEN